MSANGRGSFFAVIFLFLAACATPDLQPFATQTANIASAINAEQATISGKFNDLEALALMGQQQGWGGVDKGIGFDPRTYASLGQEYDKTARAVSEIFMAAASYSQALVNLAATGADGKGAAEKAGKDLFFNKLSKTLGGIEKTIKAFKARASEIKEAFESLNKPQDVQELINNVETVKGVLDDLKSDLQSIKDNFRG
ncbi:MAG: hypothetical protein IH996_08890 [Proteobacteria bacterium]|nr:hypothetical protein [Pseudomonadota bacterium]